MQAQGSQTRESFSTHHKQHCFQGATTSVDSLALGGGWFEYPSHSGDYYVKVLNKVSHGIVVSRRGQTENDSKTSRKNDQKYRHNSPKLGGPGHPLGVSPQSGGLPNGHAFAQCV
ncbi:hypothetical protein XENORESO_001467 [Xenotaenia resolanae]|uniref:Uncharacterized protein n=1 Tax=Xenotaenia resolanae TaxID=208358 RepID=A0ABV0W147_9TELE